MKLPTFLTALGKPILGLLLTSIASALHAHPGHLHLEGAPGDMHLHEFLFDAPALLGGLALLVLVLVCWGGIRTMRRRERTRTRARGKD